MLPLLSRLRRDRSNSKERSEKSTNSEVEIVDYYFLDGFFVENPPDKFSCPICLSPVQKKAYLTECCGRHFCYECIQRLVGSKPCPMCKYAPLNIFPNKERQREINLLAVCCPVNLVDSKEESKTKENGASEDRQETGNEINLTTGTSPTSNEVLDDAKCTVCDWKGELGQLEAHLKDKHGDDQRWSVVTREPAPACRSRVVGRFEDNLFRRHRELPYRTVHPSVLGFSYTSSRHRHHMHRHRFEYEFSDDSSDDDDLLSAAPPREIRSGYMASLTPLERAIVEIRNFPSTVDHQQASATAATSSSGPSSDSTPESQLSSLSQLSLVNHVGDSERGEASEVGSEAPRELAADSSGHHPEGNSIGSIRRIPAQFRCPHGGHAHHHVLNVPAHHRESHLPHGIHTSLVTPSHYHHHLPHPLPHPHHQHSQFQNGPPLHQPTTIHRPTPRQQHHYHLHHHHLGSVHHLHSSGQQHQSPTSQASSRSLHCPSTGLYPPPSSLQPSFQPLVQQRPQHPWLLNGHHGDEETPSLSRFLSAPPPLHWHSPRPHHSPPPPSRLRDDPIPPMQSMWYSSTPRPPSPPPTSASLWQSARPSSPLPPWEISRPSHPPPPPTNPLLTPQAIRGDLIDLIQPQEEQNSAWSVWSDSSVEQDHQNAVREREVTRQNGPARPPTPYADL